MGFLLQGLKPRLFDNCSSGSFSPGKVSTFPFKVEKLLPLSCIFFTPLLMVEQPKVKPLLCYSSPRPEAVARSRRQLWTSGTLPSLKLGKSQRPFSGYRLVPKGLTKMSPPWTLLACMPLRRLLGIDACLHQNTFGNDNDLHFVTPRKPGCKLETCSSPTAPVILY